MRLTELDQSVPETPPLPNRQTHDTTQIPLVRTAFLFREISHELGAVLIELGEDVEEKRFDVVEEGFVVEEHLGEEAEVLTVEL